METSQILRSEKKELYTKISKYLSKKLVDIQTEGKYTDLEIMNITGWTNTRISEIRNYDKYQFNIPEKHLTSLITKGFITVAELKSNLDLEPKETVYIDSLQIYELIKESPELAAALVKCKEEGVNPLPAINEALNKKA
jgi:hypothetical protein